MMIPVTLRAVAARGIPLQAHEAVAIVQQLIYSDAKVELAQPFGPPTLDTVVIWPDGRVASRSSAVTPAVSEVGRLLEDLLPPRRGVSVPGGLRYAIARALLDVDAPPFESIAALSIALTRFEGGDRRQLVRAVYARAVATPSDPAAAAVPAAEAEPPRTHILIPRTDDLSLRGPQETLRASAPHAAEIPSQRVRRSRVVAAVGALAAIAASFGLGWLLMTAKARVDAPLLPEAGRMTSLVSDAPTATPGITRADTPSSRPGARVEAVAPVSLDGTGGDMFSPSFSPDGASVYFHTGNTKSTRSALMKRTYGPNAVPTAVPIVDDGARNYHAQPSPDGTQIAFDSDRDGERAVYIADADGTNIRRVTGPGFAAVPTWSPDMRRIAFIRAEPNRPTVRNLWVVSLASRETRRLTHFTYGQTWGASWLPDGRHVCFSHEDRLILLSLEDGRMRSYPTPVSGRLVRTPAVAPDGTRAIFQVSRDGVWVIDFRTAAMRKVLDDPTAEEFAWSRDGHRVAYHSRSSGRWGIRLMAAS